jgi:hypothetical protein
VPFIGVLPERAALFQPQPGRDLAVSDAAAWRLNPAHRQVYDKLSLALAAGLRAAPCGVDPRDCGIGEGEQVFVKPQLNLAGMAIGARMVPADAVPMEPGAFWCELLTGVQTSSDCLVADGEPVWLAHTVASAERVDAKPMLWEVGVGAALAVQPWLEPLVVDWVRRNLAGYTGICNLEMIGGRPIEAHLRGSNGFFDLYGEDFLPAWVALADGAAFQPPPPVPGGYVISVFGEAEVEDALIAAAAELGVSVQLDPHTPERMAILRCTDKAAGLAVRERMLAGVR